MKKTLYSVPRALVVVLMLIGLLPASPAAAGSMTLQWDFNVEPEVTGYIVYVGSQSGVYSQSFDVGNTNAFVFDGATSGQRYYFAVAAYAGLLVSDLSIEVSGEATGTSNAVPYLFSPGNQTTTAGQSVSLQLVGGDEQQEPVTYSASGLPAGLTIGSSTGRITGAPKTAGTYSVTVTVSDGLLSTQRLFTWTVLSGTSAPGIPAQQPGSVIPQPSTSTTPPAGTTTAPVDIEFPEDSTLSLRQVAPRSATTGTAAVARPAGGSTTPTLDPRAFTGTAARLRTSDATTAAPDAQVATFTGTAALRRGDAMTSAPAGASAPTTYTGTAAVIRSIGGAAPSTSMPVSYTGTGAVTRSPEDVASDVGNLSLVNRASARALVLPQGTQESTGMIDPSSPTPTGGITAPFVSIQSTAVQASYQSGAFVTLAAIARDAQGSDLASQVMWSSSLMGHLGSGGQLSVVLTTGTHMISASVTDARGMMRTARATVVVGN